VQRFNGRGGSQPPWAVRVLAFARNALTGRRAKVFVESLHVGTRYHDNNCQIETLEQTPHAVGDWVVEGTPADVDAALGALTSEGYVPREAVQQLLPEDGGVGGGVFVVWPTVAVCSGHAKVRVLSPESSRPCTVPPFFFGAVQRAVYDLLGCNFPLVFRTAELIHRYRAFIADTCAIDDDVPSPGTGAADVHVLNGSLDTYCSPVLFAARAPPTDDREAPELAAGGCSYDAVCRTMDVLRAGSLLRVRVELIVPLKALMELQGAQGGRVCFEPPGTPWEATKESNVAVGRVDLHSSVAIRFSRSGDPASAASSTPVALSVAVVRADSMESLRALSWRTLDFSPGQASVAPLVLSEPGYWLVLTRCSTDGGSRFAVASEAVVYHVTAATAAAPGTNPLTRGEGGAAVAQLSSSGEEEADGESTRPPRGGDVESGSASDADSESSAEDEEPSGSGNAAERTHVHLQACLYFTPAPAPPSAAAAGSDTSTRAEAFARRWAHRAVRCTIRGCIREGAFAGGFVGSIVALAEETQRRDKDLAADVRLRPAALDDASLQPVVPRDASISRPLSWLSPKVSLLTLSLFPRMLFLCHTQHHRTVVEKDDVTEVGSWAHMDAAFQLMDVPVLPHWPSAPRDLWPEALRSPPWERLGSSCREARTAPMRTGNGEVAPPAAPRMEATAPPAVLLRESEESHLAQLLSLLVAALPRLEAHEAHPLKENLRREAMTMCLSSVVEAAGTGGLRLRRRVGRLDAALDPASVLGPSDAV
jgi:hypothetical protein